MNLSKKIAMPILVIVLLLTLLVCANAATDGVSCGEASYATLTKAVSAAEAGSVLQLNQNISETLTISKNVTLDLNGYSIAGTVTVAEGCTLIVKDSTTDDFTSAEGYGKITASGDVRAADDYVAIEEENGTSYHRLELRIISVNLRPTTVGIYYGGSFGGDEAVKAQVEYYGTALSLTGAPTVQEIKADKYYSKHTAFSGDSWVCGETGKAYGTLLKGIWKDTNSAQKNAMNAETQIHSVCYVQLTDGTIILGAPVSMSLRDVVEKADGNWENLDAQQTAAMQTMYEAYKDIMGPWDIPNLSGIIRHEVTFVDFDNSIIDIQVVLQGSNAQTPSDPVRKNHAFLGWDTPFTNVMSDLTVKAQYVRQYTVTFVDHDGNVLATEIVNRGDDANPPAEPSREGYSFISWDQSYINIVTDMKITAVYQLNRYTVKFMDVDGSLLETKSNGPHGRTITAPQMAEMYFNWDEMKGYRFKGWKNWNETMPIVSNMTIFADYSEEITEPIIAIESTEITKGTTTAEVSVYLCGSFGGLRKF